MNSLSASVTPPPPAFSLLCYLLILDWDMKSKIWHTLSQRNLQRWGGYNVFPLFHVSVFWVVRNSRSSVKLFSFNWTWKLRNLMLSFDSWFFIQTYKQKTVETNRKSSTRKRSLKIQTRLILIDELSWPINISDIHICIACMLEYKGDLHYWMNVKYQILHIGYGSSLG